MSILELYFFSHLVLRSFTNGIDRIYGFQSSIALSIIAIIVGLGVSIHFFRHAVVPRQFYKMIFSLMVFIVICFISFAINAYAEDNIRSSYQAWYVIVQHFYLLAILVLLACIYRSPTFVRHVYRACIIVIVVNSCVAIGQFITGHTILVMQYDKYARVAGLSAHPVTFSLEIAIIFFIFELTRRKQQMAFNLFHASVFLLAIVALILSASRTGIMLFGIVLGLYYLVRRPTLLPIFLVAAVGIVLASPFETLFSELRSVPDYILSGDFRVWDYHTAPSSFHWRIFHWYYLTSLAMSQQLWFGFGPGQVTLYSPFALEAHSQFVEIFFETGVIGLVSYCFFWFQLVRVALASTDSRATDAISSQADLRILWLMLFIGITLNSLFDVSFNLETVSFTFLLVSVFVMRAPLPTVGTARGGLPAKRAPLAAIPWAARRFTRVGMRSVDQARSNARLIGNLNATAGKRYDQRK